MTPLTFVDQGLGSFSLQQYAARDLLDALEIDLIPGPAAGGCCLTEDGRLLSADDPSQTAAAILPLGMLAGLEHTGQGPVCFSESQVRGALLPYVKALAHEGQPIQPLSLDPIARLEQLRGAAAVCSDCYCDVMMALAMGKPFFAALTPEDRDNLAGSPLYALLERLGAEGRCIHSVHTQPPQQPVDGAVEQRLAEWRDYSIACLKAYLAGEPLPAAPAQRRKQRLPRLCPPSRCTGCAACTSICPMWTVKQRPQELGFFRAHVGPDCTLCRNCESFCPQLDKAGRPALAPVAAYTARVEGERVRSAGGVFGAVARYVLSQGGMVFGAALDSDGAVRHHAAESEEELLPLLGVKFAQSDVSGVFRPLSRALSQDRLVLFVGTPCQVDGLRHALVGGRNNLITCDLACSGGASPSLLRAWRAAHPEYQDDGAMAALYQDWGTLRTTSYGQALRRGLAFPDACYTCSYAGTARAGDLTLCSLIGTHTPPPRTAEDSSIVLVNTDQGERVWNRVAAACAAVPVSWDEVLRCVPALSAPPARSAGVEAFRSAMAAWPFDEVEKTFLR